MLLAKSVRYACGSCGGDVSEAELWWMVPSDAGGRGRGEKENVEEKEQKESEVAVVCDREDAYEWGGQASSSDVPPL